MLNSREANIDNRWLDALPKRHRRLRLYADADVTAQSVNALRAGGADVTYVQELATSSRPDSFHYAEARKLRRILLTNDSDFWNDRAYPLMRSPGVVLVDCGASRNPYRCAQLFNLGVKDFLEYGQALIPDAFTQTKLRVSSEQAILRLRTYASTVEEHVLW